MTIPSISELNETRLSRFKSSVIEAIGDASIETLIPIVESIQAETEAAPEVIMAALAKIAQGDEPLILRESDRPDLNAAPPRNDRSDRNDRAPRERGGRNERGGERGGERGPKRERKSGPPSEGMQRYRIEVGHTHGAKPGNIVGAIANEANISSKNIGSIEIYDNFSTVDLPKDMPKATHDTLQKTRVAGRSLGMREWSDQPPKKRGNPANRD
jgi:ATP-dependent RNA helicase DeaD